MRRDQVSAHELQGLDEDGMCLYRGRSRRMRLTFGTMIGDVEEEREEEEEGEGGRGDVRRNALLALSGDIRLSVCTCTSVQVGFAKGFKV